MDEAARTISLISPSKSSSNFNTSNGDPTSFVLNERETRFGSGMERDRSDLSRSIRQQEILEPQPRNLVQWIAPSILFFFFFKSSCEEERSASRSAARVKFFRLSRVPPRLGWALGVVFQPRSQGPLSSSFLSLNIAYV